MSVRLTTCPALIALAGSLLCAHPASAGDRPPQVTILSSNDNRGEPSPDGKWITVFRDRAIVIVAASGRAARTIPTAGSPQKVAWSADSRTLAFSVKNYETGKQGLYAASRAHGQPRLISAETSDTEFRFDDHDHVVYLRGSPRGGTALWRDGTTSAVLAIATPAGTTSHHQLLGRYVLTTAASSPGQGGEIWSTDLARGDRRRLVSGTYGEVAVSPVEDRLCYVRDHAVRCVALAGGADREILAVPGGCAPRFGELAFSPSGRLLGVGDCRFDVQHVEVYDFDSELSRPVYTGNEFQRFSLVDDRTLMLHDHSMDYPEQRFGPRSPDVPALESVDLQTGKRSVLVADHEQYQHIRRVRGLGNGLFLSRTHESTDDLIRLELNAAVVVPRPQQPPADGVLAEYWANGKKHIEATYKHGKLDGSWTVWYWNGTKREAGRYRNGLPDGEWTTWYEAGNKREVFPWRDGKLEGAVLTWYPNGVLAEQIDHKANAADGREIVWNDSGQKVSEVGVVHGQRSGKLTTWNNGKRASEATYVNGLLDGDFRQWDAEGRLTMEGRYVAGKQDGTWSSWARGKPFYLRNYDHGAEHGEHKTWWDSGQLREQGEFRNNKKVGVWQRWDRWTGKLTEETYADGVLVK